MVEQALDPPAEPPRGDGGEGTGREERQPVFGAAEAERGRHPAAVAEVIEPPVEEVEPEAVEPVAVDRLGDDEPRPGDADRLVEHGLGPLAVMQREQQQGGVEGRVRERQPPAIVNHVRAVHARERPDVHAARRQPTARQRGADPALARPQVEDAAAHHEREHVLGLARRISTEERVDDLHEDSESDGRATAVDVRRPAARASVVSARSMSACSALCDSTARREISGGRTRRAFASSNRTSWARYGRYAWSMRATRRSGGEGASRRSTSVIPRTPRRPVIVASTVAWEGASAATRWNGPASPGVASARCTSAPAT